MTDPAAATDWMVRINQSELVSGVEAVVCPDFLGLDELAPYVSLGHVALGAQDCAPDSQSTQTGEVSATQLVVAGVKYIIVGHSERRARGESDNVVRSKTDQVLAAGAIPIVCVGETDRSGDYQGLVKAQVTAVLSDMTPQSAERIIIAYEPIWAIGEGAERPSTPVECAEMVALIKNTVSEITGGAVANVPVLYGGSSNASNASSFLTVGQADGLLVGRASLDPVEFMQMIQLAGELAAQ